MEGGGQRSEDRGQGATNVTNGHELGEDRGLSGNISKESAKNMLIFCTL